MQGKGIVKFFLVVMTFVTIIQYLFILPTKKVEAQAAKHALAQTSDIEDEATRKAAETEAERTYLDSMSGETVFKIPLLKSYTYNELKKQQLHYGLDLAGGMSVVLQIDLRELIRALALNSDDPPFVDALNNASTAQKNAQKDFVALFADAWNAEKGENDKLSRIFLSNPSLREEINLESTDGEVITMLRKKANETVSQTFNLLKKRIDKLGVVQPNINLDAERDLIIVELPGISNPQRAREFLVSAANLEFYDIYRTSEAGLVGLLQQADRVLAQLQSDEDIEPEIMSIDTSYLLDSLGTEIGISTIDTTYETSVRGPLSDILRFPAGDAIIGIANRTDVDKVIEYLNKPEVKSLFPGDLSFRFARNGFVDPEDEADNPQEQYQLYAIKIPRNGEAPLTGDVVTSAVQQPDPTSGQTVVSLNMNQEGAKKWGQMTTAAAQDNQRPIAILLDDQVVSAPSVNEPILGGSSQISGNFSIHEATDLASILQIGRLPAKAQIIQEAVVGPSLGAENIRRSIIALTVGFGLLLAFMIFYYGGGGIVSILALLLNMLFIFGALASLGTVLTLPGIAGIVLTIGMAVDANVIIFERIREELREGKSLGMAVADGFTNSYSAIIDANVTTILVAMVLVYFGLGPIKGFAVVLIIGVLSSLFTAVLVGRMMIDSWLSRGKNLTFFTGITRNAFANLKIDWLGKRKVAYMISGTIILLGIGSMFTRGWELGVDFKGGYSYNITFDQGTSVDDEALRVALGDAFEGNTPIVKAVDTDNTFNVVTDYLIDAEEIENEENGVKSIITPEERVMSALFAGVQAATGDNSGKLENFQNPDGVGTHVNSFSKVGATIADDISKSAWYAAIFSLLLIFLYIFLRFNRWQYSMGAVGALFHDTLIVLSIFSLGYGVLPFSMEIDQAFIAALLTVIGYSINDTVVVFDRIREFLNTYTAGDKKTVMNAAINSTVSRTVITSLTTMFVMLVLFVFGGTSVKGFAFALLIGIIVGTYSSIFIATPIVHDLSDDLRVKTSDDGRKSFSKAASKV